MKLTATTNKGASRDPHSIPRPYVPVLAPPPCGPSGKRLTMFLLLEYLLRLWREHQAHATDDTDLGLRITSLPREVARDSYQDFAVPYNGRPRA